MRFSVVVPIYNVERYLSECLDSLVGQIFKDFEVILINDGSTDSSPSICERYLDRYPFFRYYSQKNKGLFSARRRGSMLAKGEYLVALDSDDCLHKDALLLLDKAVTLTGAQVVCFGMSRRADYETTCDLSGANCGARPLSKHAIKKIVCGSPDLNTICGKAISRDVMNSCYAVIQDDLRLSMGEDLFQTLRLIDEADTFCTIEAELYYYRPNQSSITNKYCRDNVVDSERVYGDLLAYAEKWDSEESDNCFYSYLAASSVLCAFGALGQAAAGSMSRNLALRELSFISDAEVFKRSKSIFSRRVCSYRFDKVLIGELLANRNYLALLAVVHIKKSVKKAMGILKVGDGAQ